ncbi:MAG: transglycosylase domain-containing protein [Crocinitomicaceae bacterium]|nr:transglycosylase domain-containing protein [Crocinitomicaceae bacterium]
MEKNKKEKKEKTVFGRKTRGTLNVLFWLCAFSPVLLILFWVYTEDEENLPSVEVLENPPELLASVIFADDGKTELGRYWSVNRTSIDYKDISPFVFDALISTEDERYMTHPGVDLKALTRAIVRLGKDGGGSTISQQLAKLLFTLQKRERDAILKLEGKELESERTGIWKRVDEKVKENIIAVRLEERYTKEEIITMYLNQFDFLYNAVGIENAAKVYFNKVPMDLTKCEAAVLVGMCINPSYNNPRTYTIKDYTNSSSTREKDSLRMINRRNTVLHQWLKNSNEENPALQNFITQAEYDSLKNTPIIVDYQLVDHKEGLAPYFRESLRSELSDLFKQTDENGDLIYKKKNGEPYNIYKDGLKIYTTINVDLQTYAEAAVKRHLSEDLQPQFDKNNRNLKLYPFSPHKDITEESVERNMSRSRKRSDRYLAMQAQGLSVQTIEESFNRPLGMKVFSWDGDIDTVLTPNDSIRYYKTILRAGLLSIEPSTGFVKAWVGGTDFKHFAYDHVRQSRRQVGSTIKPFVYSTALLMGVVSIDTKFEVGTSYCVDTYGNNGELNSRWCPRGEIKTRNGASPTVAWGLANSNNPITVAVMSKMGGYSGPKTISKLLRDLNINLRTEDEVPPMCLGVMDLSLFEMVPAQAMFVNQGIFVAPTTVLRIEDRNGNVIYSAEPYTKEVLNSGVAYTTLKMMKGVVDYGTAGSLRAGWRKWGGITAPMAGKTGTTQDNSDGWFMGLTPDLVTGIWVGAEDRYVRFRSMEWGQGARMALPIYGYYMQEAYKNKKLKLSTEDFAIPVGYDPRLYVEEPGDSGPDIDLFGN